MNAPDGVDAEAALRARVDDVGFAEFLGLMVGDGCLMGDQQTAMLTLSPDERADRVAQLVVQRLPRVELTETDELPDTVRGAGGFGSARRAPSRCCASWWRVMMRSK